MAVVERVKEPASTTSPALSCSSYGAILFASRLVDLARLLHRARCEPDLAALDDAAIGHRRLGKTFREMTQRRARLACRVELRASAVIVSPVSTRSVLLEQRMEVAQLAIEHLRADIDLQGHADQPPQLDRVEELLRDRQ